MRRFGLGLRALVVSAASVVVLLQQTAIWKHAPKGLLIPAVILLGLLAAVEPYARDRRRTSALARERKIRAALVEALVRVEEITTIKCQAMGVHAFVVRKRWRLLQRWWPSYLHRVVRLRLAGLPVPSDIRWTHGKGVVGECWRLEREFVFDVQSIHAPLLGMAPETVKQLSREVTLGMSARELTMTADKYGAVAAVPITTERGVFQGCVSLDAPDDAYDALGTAPVLSTLRDAAQTIAGVLDRGD